MRVTAASDEWGDEEDDILPLPILEWDGRGTVSTSEFATDAPDESDSECEGLPLPTVEWTDNSQRD